MSDLHFGVYRGICKENEDPENYKRIRLLVPQILGNGLSEWAWPCLPVTSNSNHPDHKKHLASEVANLLVNHTATFTSSNGGSTPHTHTTAVTFSHTGNALELDHEHVTPANTEELWNDDQETNTTAEHTPHRLVPRIDQGVWVMFEGGDSNFPIWIGVY